MANTLCDHNVDLINDFNIADIVRTLVGAGWPAHMIHIHLDAATLMATIRQHNERSK